MRWRVTIIRSVFNNINPYDFKLPGFSVIHIKWQLILVLPRPWLPGSVLTVRHKNTIWTPSRSKHDFYQRGLLYKLGKTLDGRTKIQTKGEDNVPVNSELEP